MKNTFGQSLTITLFGESHGPAIGVVLDGVAPGLLVDTNEINRLLSRRRPSGLTDTARQEPDNYQILSGVFENRTTGTPICIMIPNTDTRSRDYEYGPARPSHADFAAYCKYHGNEDYRGGGHFSGRITAALTAAGGILLPALGNLGITLGTHILKCGDVVDRPLEDSEDVKKLNESTFPVLDESKGEEMVKKIVQAKDNLDSIGGITETSVFGLPAGLGEPWFDSVESVLSHALFGIGGVKGVEFGLGFGFAETTGSVCNDAFRNVDGKIVTKTNNNGGVNGGITNGMPVKFRCAVKPTPSISRPQETVDFRTGEKLNYLTNDTLESFIVYSDPTSKKEISIYDREKGATDDGYEFFLSGSLAFIRIVNPNATTDRKLYIFRDSFGSSLGPLLASGYAETILIDIRSLPSDRVKGYVNFDNADVLFLFSSMVLNNSSTLK